MAHAPYSPDLTPSNYFVYSYLKSLLVSLKHAARQFSSFMFCVFVVVSLSINHLFPPEVLYTFSLISFWLYKLYLLLQWIGEFDVF